MKKDTKEALDYYLSEIKRFPILSKEDEIDLIKKAKSGCLKSKELFLNSNLRLVVSVAVKRKYNNVTLSEIIQEGNIGLMIALDKFRLEKDCKFSTYAIWWIRQAVSRFVMNFDRNVRLPVHIQSKAMNYINGKSDDNSMMIHFQSIESLDSIIDNTDISIIDSMIDESIDVEKDSINSNTKYKVLLKLEELPTREKFVLKNRFFNEHTLEEIGKMMNVTRERVRQIETEAMERLRFKIGIATMKKSDFI